MKSFRYRSQHIRENKFDSLNQVFLHTDAKRTFKVYSTMPDINGKYVIKVQEGSDNDVHADYAWVHFALSYNEPISDGNLYIFGSLSYWNFLVSHKLKYNDKTHFYEKAIYLKQGYYNYEYAYLKDGKKQGDVSYVEGTHYYTKNAYTILAYYKDFGGDYDQLIGIIHLSQKY